MMISNKTKNVVKHKGARFFCVYVGGVCVFTVLVEGFTDADM